MASNALEYIGPVKRGRPSIYSDELAKEICERIAAGETLTKICEEDDMPSVRSVSGWLMRNEAFFADYRRARETQQHVETEQMLDIADDLSILPEHKKIMISTRQWRAERLAKRFYSPTVKHEHQADLHPAAGAEQLPEGLSWLSGFLPGGDAPAGPGSDPGGVGEE